MFTVAETWSMAVAEKKRLKVMKMRSLRSVCIWGDVGLVTSGQASQLRVPHSSPGTYWPIFFGNTTEWPKITHMLP